MAENDSDSSVYEDAEDSVLDSKILLKDFQQEENSNEDKVQRVVKENLEGKGFTENCKTAPELQPDESRVESEKIVEFCSNDNTESTAFPGNQQSIPSSTTSASNQFTNGSEWQQEFSSVSDPLQPDEAGAPSQETVNNDMRSRPDLAIDLELLEIEEKSLTEEQLEKRHQDSLELKETGNQRYRDCAYKEAAQEYTQGLRTCPLKFHRDRAVLHSNRAAALIAQV